MNTGTRTLWFVATLVFPSALGAQRPITTDTSWRAYLAFLPRGTGIWLTSNERYRTTDNGEPRAYGQRYWLGFGGTTVHGCLWGEYGEQRPVFWYYFAAWDPDRKELLLHQESGNGTIGLGYESVGTGVAEQTFSRPDGTSSVSRHISKRPTADSLITENFDRDGNQWRPQRVYTWVKQPVGTSAGC